MKEPIKFVRPGGCINHIGIFFLCLFSCPILVGLAWAFGSQIDQFFEIWEHQFIFVMALFLSLGVWRFVKKILN